ncbi:MAG: acyl-CoA dehydrogenase family protein, partial [Nitrospinota bacterium]
EGRFPEAEVKRAGALGFFGLTIPQEYGGGGEGALSLAAVMEEMARADASFALTLAAHLGLCAAQILLAGSEEQKARYLPLLARAEELGAWALTEPGAGSDAAALRSRATPREGGWTLSGTKLFVSQGARFGVAVVMAKSDPARGRRGISAFLVEGSDPGRTSRLIGGKLGMRSSETAEMAFESCPLAAGRLLGREGGGYEDAMRVLDEGRIGIGALAAGVGSAALETALRHAKEREAFRGPIARLGAIRNMLADSATELEAARLLVWRAAALKDAGREFRREASMAKLFASEAALRAADRALQIHGGYGYIDEYPVQRYYRDARLLTIGEGTSEVQRRIIARETLGL